MVDEVPNFAATTAVATGFSPANLFLIDYVGAIAQASYIFN